MKNRITYISGLCLVFLLVAFCGQSQTPIVKVFNEKVVEQLELKNEKWINTADHEFSPAFYYDKLAFVYNGDLNAQMDEELNEKFFNIGFAARDTSGEFRLKAAFDPSINDQLHEGPLFVDQKGNRLYYTKVEYVYHKRRNKDVPIRRIMQKNISGQGEPSPLSFSTEDRSVCHPTLNSNLGTIVFAGDMAVDQKMDLFASFHQEGEWQEPFGLSSNINTEANEIFPNFVTDSILIFASDRPNGFGGLDLYATTKRNNQWSVPQLLPAPLNSEFDDFGLIMTADGKKGFLSSNRPGGKGKDDIYSFNSNVSLFDFNKEEQVAVRFNVLDKLSFQPISKVELMVTPLLLSNQELNVEEYNINLISSENQGELVLKLSPKEGKALPIIYSDENGVVQQQLFTNKNYLVVAKAYGYEDNTFLFNMLEYGSNVDIVLEPKEVAVPNSSKIRIPTTAGSKIVFNSIYYDRNSAVIKEGAAAELDALSNAMMLNPTIKVTVAAHTDSRGAASYNQKLSEQRAAAAKAYLTERGIDPVRIEVVGMGEQEIRNRCKEGVECEEEEHRFNRRTEVIIRN